MTPIHVAGLVVVVTAAGFALGLYEGVRLAAHSLARSAKDAGVYIELLDLLDRMNARL